MNRSLLACLGLLASGAAVARGDPPTREPPPISASVRLAEPEPGPGTEALERRLAEGQRRFALALHGELRHQRGNLLFSPWSIHSALSMARAGARGETAAEMDRVLHLPEEGGAAGWAGLVAKVTRAPRVLVRGEAAKEPSLAYTLSVANALFGQRGADLRPAFLDLVRRAFAAQVGEVDFAGASEAARGAINAWVLERTRGRIRDLLGPGAVDSDTLLVLVNALHFEAQWERAFELQLTRPMDFRAEDGALVRVAMMTHDLTLRLLEDADARVLALPYRGGLVEMLLVLPQEPRGLARLEAGLTPARVERWGREGAARAVTLYLPRFKFEAGLPLKPALEALGMPNAFERRAADFGGVAPPSPRGLWIDDVIHRAFIAVDEKGTEAAAATATVVSRGGGGSDEEPEEFVCDRPFLFLIRHVATGVLLFVGRLSQPEPAAG